MTESSNRKLVDCIHPSYLSVTVRADDRRCEFDCKNQTVLQKKLDVDIVMAGDSITQMWELPAYFGNSGLCILNRGIGGDRTKYLLHRFMADVVQLKPKLCVIMIGINDTWDLEPDYFRPGPVPPVKEILKKALANMAEIVTLSKKNNQKIVLCSILPSNMYWTEHEKERHTFIKAYNTGLKSLCVENGIDFIDYYPDFLAEDNESMKMSLSVEGVHPNVFGYDLMYEKLKAYLKTLFPNNL